MSADVLSRIDGTLFAVRDTVDHSTEDGLCVCGCGGQLDPSSPSGWWTRGGCMQLYLSTIDRPHLRKVHIGHWPTSSREWFFGGSKGFRPAGPWEHWGQVVDFRYPRYEYPQLWEARRGEMRTLLVNHDATDKCALMQIPRHLDFCAVAESHMAPALLHHVNETTLWGRGNR